MNKNGIWKVYEKYADFYDFLFGKVLDQGRRKAVALMDLKGGERVIEIGVGTGLSFKHYPKSIKLNITGIDLSKKMLEKAKARSKKFHQLEVSLYQENGEKTPYKSSSFDKVALMYVYSVTPNPNKLIAEAARICKDKGKIYIVNHFSNYKKGRLTFFEKMASPFSAEIGFRSNFSYAKYIEQKKIKFESIDSANIFSLTKVIAFKKDKNLHLTNSK